MKKQTLSASKKWDRSERIRALLIQKKSFVEIAKELNEPYHIVYDTAKIFSRLGYEKPAQKKSTPKSVQTTKKELNALLAALDKFRQEIVEKFGASTSSKKVINKKARLVPKKRQPATPYLDWSKSVMTEGETLSIRDFHRKLAMMGKTVEECRTILGSYGIQVGVIQLYSERSKLRSQGYDVPNLMPEKFKNHVK